MMQQELTDKIFNRAGLENRVNTLGEAFGLLRVWI